MCGITGILQRVPDAQAHERNIDRMRDALSHRGPDDRGSWIDSDAPHVALGHRRLSIVDLSPRGAQPMHSSDGRYVLVFNGEIYNFRRLRENLRARGHDFNGSSDTEVVLAAFVEWGIAAALPAFEGMFAIAVWDRRDRMLYLARDRFGEKPLYYGVNDGVLLFGSELKALARHERFVGEIDRGALAELMRLSYIPGPSSIFRHYRKLPPGTWLRIGTDLEPTEPTAYFDVDKLADAQPERRSDNAAVDELERLLSHSIAERMVADVPVGAFLSGGIDSSLIVSLMRTHTDRPVRTFTIGFDEPGLNEAEQARETATVLGTDHHELYVSEADLLATVPRLPAIYDEPFADPSQIPTTLVSRMARDQVTVALSGDGGDEMMAGYDRYEGIARRWRRHQRTPPVLRAGQAAWLTAQARARPAKSAKYLQQRAMKRAGNDLRCFYRNSMSYWHDPRALVADAPSVFTAFLRDTPAIAAQDPQRWLQATDALCYLPDDIMVKVDRAAMASSLETRAPFLDSKLAAFAFSLPPEQQFRDGKPKWLSRQLLYRYLPRETVERPKHGFNVPLANWLRGPLREWAEALLEPQRLRREGYFDVALVRWTWHTHLAGSHDWHWRLWCILMFQAWLEDFFKPEPSASAH
ncbi:asparagine synthase (glutamine-hydrolyzing) [Salinisphaera sp.]|uniref:asparagine synthase (glutamine-hydrolyzing) n=1 Tax=Salinisphaera sp. TaxID=1914330 RepID=UPI000C4F1083|nr:asparagine synthase (glutamine-hydrolyzing) [Salinisphaera sp.]MBS63833.1 asparagine synthase (glutamine-hydrolyzing) [Salinisphaera sp.]